MPGNPSVENEFMEVTYDTYLESRSAPVEVPRQSAAIPFIQFRIISPRKKHEAELKSHLQKLLNGVRRSNLFQSQCIIVDQVKAWET